MEIVKSSGEREAFNKDKFCDSLREIDVPEDVVKNVCGQIEGEMRPGMTTSNIFRVATRHLVEANPAAAARYGLKRGIGDLGPAGFLFEQFIEVLLLEMGYTTLKNQIMEGRCVSHEVDVYAQKNKEHFLVEAKYHNRVGIKTHIDVIMYADARLVDIASSKKNKEMKDGAYSMWLITNTKFTSKAIRYGKCRDIRMLGWNYPKNEGLKELVERYSLYPVTVLPAVNRYARERFAEYGMMLVRDLAVYSPQDLISKFAIHEDYAHKIIKQAHSLIYGEEK